MPNEKLAPWNPAIALERQRPGGESTPHSEQVAEAEVRRVRAELMGIIKKQIAAEGWTQKEAAVRFGVSQPRISEIVQGKTELFTIDKLIELLGRTGRVVDVRVNRRDA